MSPIASAYEGSATFLEGLLFKLAEDRLALLDLCVSGLNISRLGSILP